MCNDIVVPMETKNISQAAMARRIGISPSRLCRILNGEKPIGHKMAYEWVKKFGQDMEFWLHANGDQIWDQLIKSVLEE